MGPNTSNKKKYKRGLGPGPKPKPEDTQSVLPRQWIKIQQRKGGADEEGGKPGVCEVTEANL